MTRNTIIGNRVSSFLRGKWGLISALILAVILRLLYILFYRGPDFVYWGSRTCDSWWYHNAALVMVNDPFSLASSLHPPLYSALLAVIYSTLGIGFYKVAFIQIAIDVCSIVLLWLLVKRAVKPETGGVAAFLFAVYPSFIFYTGNLLSEGLYIFLLIGFAVVLTGVRENGKIVSVLAGGLILGLAILTRSNAILILPLLTIWMVVSFGWKKGLLRWLLLVAVTVLVILPWQIHSYRVHEGFVILSTGGGFAFYGGNREGAIGYFHKPQGYYANDMKAGHTELKISREMYGKGINWIKSDPYGYMKLTLLKIWRFIEPYPPMQSGTAGIVKTITGLLFHLPILPFLIVGLTRIFHEKKNRLWLLSGILVFTHFITAIAFFGGIRTRDPIMPFIIIIISVGVVSLLSRSRKRVEFKAAPKGTA